MRHKKGLVFGLMAVFVLSLAMMVTAYRGNFEEKGPEYTEERCTEMTKAFDELDYEAWKALKQERNSKALHVINEENFYLFVEAREAMKNNDYELAQSLREELGLNNGVGPKNGEGFGKSEGRGQMKGHGQGVGGAQQFKNKQI